MYGQNQQKNRMNSAAAMRASAARTACKNG